MMEALIVFVILAVLVIVVIAKTAVVVPQQSAFVVERLGKYRATLHAGFHMLVPFVDAIRYRHSLKEIAVDIPEQVCITRDNVQVHVDGVIYLKVLDPQRASYGVADYMFAISQLAQTTLRSEVGKIDLDRTFEERTNINLSVVSELDKASEPWGVKVLRYEIKNITPPKDILAAMERMAWAWPSASLICCCRLASEALMTCCFCPSALLTAASRSPSDCRITARFSRSARICFSMAAMMSAGGVMFLIS